MLRPKETSASALQENNLRALCGSARNHLLRLRESPLPQLCEMPQPPTLPNFTSRRSFSCNPIDLPGMSLPLRNEFG